MKLLFATSIFLLLNQHVASQKTTSFDKSQVKHDLNIYYTEEKDSLQSLDVYWDCNSTNAEVLMFVHGGGWLSGDKNQYRELAATLANNGFTVVLVNYRLSPKVKFPAHIEDLASALNWVNDSIEYYQGDKENIYLIGHSAGGHLASLILLDKSYLEKYDLKPTNIAGAIIISGVFEIKPQEGGATKKYLGMVFESDKTNWHRATCKNHINNETKNNVPPLLISWGKHESKLIVNESINFINELKNNKIEVQSFSFDSNSHNAFKEDLMNSSSEFHKKLLDFVGNK